MKKSNVLVLIAGLCAIVITVVFPAAFALFVSPKETSISTIPSTDSFVIIVQTVVWSLFVAIIATLIGWPVGLRIATLQKNIRAGVLVLLVMTLVIPSYAVFYVWWQCWPSGTLFHAFVVEHHLLRFATMACLAVALIGWSWPIPALISTMSAISDRTLAILQQLDGRSRWARIIERVRYDKKLLVASVVLVAAFVASNTTSFDLAQVVTIGNELRSVVASGGSAFDVPALSLTGLVIAILASLTLVRNVPRKRKPFVVSPRSLFPMLSVWMLLSGLPLVIAVAISGSALVQLFSLYAGDIVLSVGIAAMVAFVSILIFIGSASMHLSLCSKTRMTAKVLDFIWIVAAFLPASLVSSALAMAWHGIGADFVYRTPLILVLALLTKVGFIASLSGRWVASCQHTKTLCEVDGVSSMRLFLSAARARLIVAGALVVGVAFAISISEVALTNQLYPPATHQPIAVALLNAMHYQRPQIVTSAFILIITVACTSGLCALFVHRKFATMFLFVLLVSCNSHEQAPVALASVIGGAGQSDGRFTTPRAIASNDSIIVVIDKTGRLQRFTHGGKFLSSWDLQLSGTGFPTGVSIDDEGLIWIADTHQQRIVVLDQEGIEVNSFGEYGTGDGQFLYPTDIAFGKDGEVFVSEYGGNDRINVFTREGIFQYSFGYFGSDENGFLRPQSMAISPVTGNLFISDAGNHRIVERTPLGEVVQTIGSAGREQGELLYPYGIVFDAQDTFLVCEFGNNRLQRFSVEGKSLQTFGGAGDKAGLFKTPWAVETGPEGVIVADTGNNRLQRLPDMMVY
jgi:DNA-binding beta-propeller fold protein YncE